MHDVPFLQQHDLGDGKVGPMRDTAAEQLQRTVHTSVGPDHARDGERYVLDPPPVVARVVDIEHPLRQLKLAPTHDLELQQRKWEVKAQ